MTDTTTPAALPPLPEPTHRGPDGTGAYFDSFTAAQMRSYAEQAVREALAQQAPIDMVLHCPKCGKQHIDAPEPERMALLREATALQVGDWTNPPHCSHLCHSCGHLWRPADVPTNGVAAVKTKGKADSPIVAAQPSQSAVELAQECKRLAVGYAEACAESAVDVGSARSHHWGKHLASPERELFSAIDRLASLAQPAPAGDEQTALLDVKPHFDGCETPEPSLSALIYRYYRLYFDQPKADEYAARYIAALCVSHPTAQAAGEAKASVAVPEYVCAVRVVERDGQRGVCTCELIEGHTPFVGDTLYLVAAAPQPTKEGE